MKEKEMTVDELREMLKFDKNNLDEEFLLYPMNFETIGRKSVLAANERDRAKQRLDVKKAELDSLIRKKPESFGITEKLTENAISSIILFHKQYITVNDEYLDLRKEADVLEVLKEAMRMKLTAMTYVFKLYESSYFADGKMPKRGKDAQEADFREKQSEQFKKSTRLQK